MSSTIVLEFYPSPYGHDIDVQARAWKSQRTITSYLLEEGWQIKALHTAVRGPDCYFQVDVEDVQALKTDLERNPLVAGVEIAPITIKTLDPPEFDGLRVHVPLQLQRRRR